MMRLSRLSSAAGGYYLADMASELTAALAAGGSGVGERRDRGAHLSGRWWGDAAARLGLTGPVAAETLAAALAGRHPRTGRVMTARRDRTGGYDLTFAAPKSVSVVFALGGPDVAAEVLDAHQRAVEAAMGYVSAHALSARRSRDGERAIVAVDGPIVATFPHGVSRSLDPHLHTHVLVANLAHGADGRWTALDGRGLFAHAAAAGRAYDAHLRRQVGVRLGLGWSLRRSGSYELADVDPVVLGAFSGRRAEIREQLASRPRPSRRGHTVAWAVTRSPKDAELTPADLQRRWRDSAAGVGARDLEELVRGRTRSPAGRAVDEPGEVDEHRFAAALSRTPHATASRRDAVAAWAAALPGGAPVTEIGRCVDALADWGSEIGVAERPRALADLVPAPHLIRELGPRPASSSALRTWLGAAASVERYRRNWLVDRAEPSRHALGIAGDTADLARLPARRLADHLAIVRELGDARRRLGRERAREHDVLELALDIG